MWVLVTLTKIMMCDVVSPIWLLLGYFSRAWTPLYDVTCTCPLGEVLRTRGSHHPVWSFSLYSDDKKKYGTHVTIYLEREKRLKFLVLLVMWVKGVVSPPLWYTMILWVWVFPYHLVVTLTWLMVLLVLAPLLYVVPWPPLVWWLNLIIFYCFIVMWP